MVHETQRRLEVLDDHTMSRRHNMTIHDVQQFVFDKFNTGDAEEGSYVAQQLSDDEPDDDDDGFLPVDTEDEHEDT